MVRRRSHRRARAVALGAGLALLGLPGAASAHGFPASVPRVVALPHGARRVGIAPASESLRVTVALKPRRPRALAAYAAAVSSAGSPDYRRYLSVAQFARRFAPTPAQRRLVRRQLSARGLVVGATSANGLSIVARGSARVASGAFATAIERYALPDGTSALAPAVTPHLSGRAGALVQGVVGLDSVAPTTSIVIRRRRATGRPAGVAPVAHASAAAGPQPCAAARATASGQGGFTATQIAARYGLSNFYAAGDQGRGVTIAVYELEPFSVSDISAYQTCMGTDATLELETVAGGAGSGPGSGEAATDIEDLIGLAPRATIRVYEGPSTGNGAYETYAAIVSDDAAQVVSTSWGLCEPELGATVAHAESTLFEEAAAQGQTVIAAAGDAGADDCANGSRAVDDPAAQPWVTGVGGTSVHGAADTVWDDSFGAGGGGASQLWGRPAWQTTAIPQSVVSCGASATACREVPDLSADADPGTGYAIDYRGAWRVVGGTSAAAPTVAALAALADASPGCAGHPLGFLAPALYAHATDFTDVTSGANSFGGALGFAAGPGYDMASGLGTPTAALGPALCGDSLRLAAPAAQTLMTGRAVALAGRAMSARSAAITWSATGLPAGLAISSATGRITGVPRATGRSTVVLTARDADGAIASASFSVTVARAPAPSPTRTMVPRAGAPVHRHRAATARRRHRRARLIRHR